MLGPCFVLLCVLSSFVIISLGMRERELVAKLLLGSWYCVANMVVIWLFTCVVFGMSVMCIVDSEIFARILFLRMALKYIIAM